MPFSEETNKHITIVLFYLSLLVAVIWSNTIIVKKVGNFIEKLSAKIFIYTMLYNIRTFVFVKNKRKIEIRNFGHFLS
jgi:hypothetical protein